MKRSVLNIEAEIRSLQERLKKIRAKCAHPREAVIDSGANTGNYDPNDDIYWKDFKCIDCGARRAVYKNRHGEVVNEA